MKRMRNLEEKNEKAFNLGVEGKTKSRIEKFIQNVGMK